MTERTGEMMQTEIATAAAEQAYATAHRALRISRCAMAAALLALVVSSGAMVAQVYGAHENTLRHSWSAR